MGQTFGIREIAEEAGRPYTAALKVVHDLGFETPRGRANPFRATSDQKRQIIAKLKVSK